MADSLGNDITQAGKQAVHAGKTIAKAAAKASAGNVAGAVKDVLSDEALIRTILVTFITIMLIIAYSLVFVLFIFPMAIYEAIQNLIATANQAFWDGFFANGQTGWKSVAVGIAKGTAEWVKSTWNTITSAVGKFFSDIFSFFDGSSVSKTYNIDDIDFGVATDKGAPQASLIDKLDHIQEKYSARVEAIQKAIENFGKAWYGGDNYLTKKTKEMFEETYNKTLQTSSGTIEEWDEYRGATWIPAFVEDELSDLQKLRIAALYDVLNDNNFQTTRLSDFLKWLGYGTLKSKGDTLYFNLLDTEASVDGWTGNYMPMYLMDEAKIYADEEGQKARQEEIDREKTPVEDALSTEKKERDRLQQLYDKAYIDKLQEYYDKYGVSVIDFLIYVYNGEIAQTEKLGQLNDSKNLMRPNGVPNAAPGIPASYTYNNWATDDHGTRQTFLEFWATNFPNYVEYSATEDYDSGTEGCAVVQTEWRDRTYVETLNITYTNGTFLYNGQTTNPYAGNPYAHIAFENYKSQYGLEGIWGYQPTLAYRNGNSLTGVSGTIQFQNVVQEQWVTAKFYKFYYVVSYSCPYYIGMRSENELLDVSGLLQDDHIEEYKEYWKAKGGEPGETDETP